MPEVSYDALSEVVNDIRDGKTSPVYLLYGDEFLFKSAFKAMLDALVPAPKAQSSNCERLDGNSASIHEIIEHMQTFSLFPGPKVVVVFGANVFHSKTGSDELLLRSKEAFEKGDMNRAARYFVQVLSVADMSVQDVRDMGLDTFFEKVSAQGLGNGGEKGDLWINQLVDFCSKEQMAVLGHEDDGNVLCDAIEHGLPVGNCLILATELVDKRKRLYKTINKTGVIVDCSITKGARAAELRQQKEILNAHLAKTLGQAGKTAAPGTFQALFERTGANLRTFDSEVEKLISFVGESKAITVDDVERASEKSREDPVYELANAVGERVVRKALSNVDGLLRANLFPLQILSAVTNQIRKLILSKDVINGLPRGKWKKSMNYPAFQRTVLPELGKHQSDLITGKTHPFVLYKTFTHSENYSFGELTRGLEYCLDADRRLKTSRQSPKLVLEDLVIKVCSSQ